ncbi:hypothetical protein CTRI78_v007789 [Colletotrichum trifolii]|uniref:Uncharacterized protein n=1 Tax=Colletotrichum trifolii TaxID=5466 RepID=A0A4R8R127_COLTR|nr:hypothetical protein CTRI78_v007789 [Colletotrichum trifolii]
MQLQCTIVLSFLATAINAALTCVEGAPLPENHQERSYFSRQPNGIYVASFSEGYANFVAPSLASKEGVLEIANQGVLRLSVCVLHPTEGLMCYWVNSGDICETNASVDTNWNVKVSYPIISGTSCKKPVNVNKSGPV